jgi:amino acid permease
MKYLNRLAAVLAVLFVLALFVFAFPFLAAYYIITGKDITAGFIKLFPGR